MTIQEWDLFLAEQHEKARELYRLQRQHWEDTDPDFSAWICEQNLLARCRRSPSSPAVVKRNFWDLFIENLKDLI